MRWRVLAVGALLVVMAVEASAQEQTVELRNWFVNLQLASGRRDTYEVFDAPMLPQSEVQDPGRGGGGTFGYRFGERFLLGLQLTVLQHELAGLDDVVNDVEGLLTGTVLFNQRGTLQPFLRGGIGGSGLALEQTGADGHTTVFGTAAVAGGGVQIRVSSRVSFELEIVATFVNYMEEQVRREGEPEADLQVRDSSYGSRSGLGISIWF